MAALSSLTEAYTDSDDEDIKKPEKDIGGLQGSPGSPVGPPSILDRFRERNRSKDNTPSSSVRSKHSEGSRSARSTPAKKMTSLVSYIDPDDEAQIESNDDEDQEDTAIALQDHNTEGTNSDSVPMDLDDSDDMESLKNDDAETEPSTSTAHVWSDGITLPPEPPGQCSARLQESINRLMQLKKQDKNFDMNASIQNRKAFRNPSIYEKLIEFCGIDEHGTNFPKELYDGHLFGKESYYDELSKELDAMERARIHAAKIMRNADDPAHLKMVNMVLKKMTKYATLILHEKMS